MAALGAFRPAARRPALENRHSPSPREADKIVTEIALPNGALATSGTMKTLHPSRWPTLLLHSRSANWMARSRTFFGYRYFRSLPGGTEAARAKQAATMRFISLCSRGIEEFRFLNQSSVRAHSFKRRRIHQCTFPWAGRTADPILIAILIVCQDDRCWR